MFASVGGVETSLVVQPVRERGDHDIDIVAFQRRMVVVHELDIRVLVLPPNGGFRSLFRHDFEFSAGSLVHDIDIRSADSPGAENCYASQFARSLSGCCGNSFFSLRWNGIRFGVPVQDSDSTKL